MTTQAAGANGTAARPVGLGGRLIAGIDKRYLAPFLVTIVLLVGQLTFGFLESWSRTLLAILTAIGVEVILARLMWGRWPHLASAYISGISIGMLVRSPAIWPYALCSAISITSCSTSTRAFVASTSR